MTAVTMFCATMVLGGCETPNHPAETSMAFSQARRTSLSMERPRPVVYGGYAQPGNIRPVQQSNKTCRSPLLAAVNIRSIAQPAPIFHHAHSDTAVVGHSQIQFVPTEPKALPPLSRAAGLSPETDGETSKTK